jgi:uncharacterized protein
MTATLTPSKLPIALAALATLLLSTPASAAAFNCNYAKLPTEVLLCQDGTLGRLDEANARVYSAVKNALPQWAKHEYDNVARQWLKERNNCGFDAACVSHQYDLRFAYMCNIGSRLNLQDCKDVQTASNPYGRTGDANTYGTIGVDPWDPDPFLALRTEPNTQSGQRIAKMRNGSNVEVLATQTNGWWFVRTSEGQTGWAKSGAGYDGLQRVWIHTECEECD